MCACGTGGVCGELLPSPLPRKSGRICRHICLPKVADTAVIAIDDERSGQRPKAYVVLKPEMTLSEEEVVGMLRENLADYKLPAEVCAQDDAFSQGKCTHAVQERA